MLEVRNLTLKIGKHKIFKNLSFSANYGELLLIKGSSGSGKSSLLQVINQIIPNVLDGEVEGQVLIDGEEINGMEIPQLSPKLAYMMQDSETQLCTFNVKDELLFGMENLRMSKETMEERLDFVINLFNLHEIIDEQLTSLSGGQMQKVAFASLVAINPDIYLLDEPTANLDPATTNEILNIVNLLVKKYGKMVIIVEHKIDDILPFVDKIYEIETNSIIEENIYEVLNEYVRTYRLPKNDNIINYEENILLEANHIDFFYDNKQVLFDINLKLHQGEIIGLIGKNGAGKSTLSNILSGLRKKHTGEVIIDGKDIRRYSDKDLGKKIGLVFQNPENQFVRYTVEEELAVGLKVRNVDEKTINREVDKYLKLFKLEDKRKNNPFQLSQGEKRKLSTASMLITGQKILILDEPTYGQDRENLANLMNLLFDISKTGVGMIMVSHDMEVIKNSCNTIFKLDYGRVTYNEKASGYLYD